MEPNVVSYSAMIDACAKVGDAAKAQRWHQRMRNEGVQPNAHSYSAVINAMAKSGHLLAAYEEFERMEQAGVVADVVVYSGLLDACAKAGDLVKAKEVFARSANAWNIDEHRWKMGGKWVEMGGFSWILLAFRRFSLQDEGLGRPAQRGGLRLPGEAIRTSGGVAGGGRLRHRHGASRPHDATWRSTGVVNECKMNEQ